MPEPLFILKLLCSSFLAILFIQSGLDKVFNYSGNKEWLTDHFSESPLKGMVGLMLPIITVLELGAGLFSGFGIFSILIGGEKTWSLLGAYLSAVSILALFFGQRLAQDYAGAATLTGYFLIAIASIFIYSY